MRLDFQIMWFIIILSSTVEMTFALKRALRSAGHDAVARQQLKTKPLLANEYYPSFDESGRYPNRRDRRGSGAPKKLRTKRVLSEDRYPSYAASSRHHKPATMIKRRAGSGGLARQQTRRKRLLAEGCYQSCEDSVRDQQPATVSPSRNVVACAKTLGTGLAAQAAQEAKQASDEMASAVKIASDRIKLEYADKAASAARAAEAVLASKQQMLQQLEMEVREGEAVVQEETAELCAAETHSALAMKTYQQAKEALNLLMSSIKMSRVNLDNSDMVAAACQQFVADKSALMNAAQKRVQLLLHQLAEARADHAKTKKAADKAECAANEAKQRSQQQTCHQ